VSARLAVLVSGGGRSLENLVERSRRGELAAEVVLAIADRPAIGALERCARLGVPALVIDYKEAGGVEGFSARVFRELDERGVRLCVLAGFLRLVRVPPAWRGRVLNIHPALLPKYGGKGYYGDRVHAAVLAAGERESGCTVHHVDDHYDHGAHVLQKRVPVLPGDDVHSLAARVFEAETQALPEAIELVLAKLAAAARTP
jgi:formyltetrahydrofolate-dependent phosphoribosylglycinamide formyltransferase